MHKFYSKDWVQQMGWGRRIKEEKKTGVTQSTQKLRSKQKKRGYVKTDRLAGSENRKF